MLFRSYEITSVAFLGTLKVNLPSTSVMVPIVAFPFTMMLAPMMGSPSPSNTVPATCILLCCDSSVIGAAALTMLATSACAAMLDVSNNATESWIVFFVNYFIIKGFNW